MFPWECRTEEQKRQYLAGIAEGQYACVYTNDAKHERAANPHTPMTPIWMGWNYGWATTFPDDLTDEQKDAILDSCRTNEQVSADPPHVGQRVICHRYPGTVDEVYVQPDAPGSPTGMYNVRLRSGSVCTSPHDFWPAPLQD